MQPLLLAMCHLAVIYHNLGVIWPWVCVKQLATDVRNRITPRSTVSSYHPAPTNQNLVANTDTYRSYRAKCRIKL